MYITIRYKHICLHCGKNGHLKDTNKARVKAIRRSMQYVEKGKKEEPGSSLKDARQPGQTQRHFTQTFFSHKGTQVSLGS